ncbi:hypothetical protein [Abyssibius alkaniclasticus]|uniref:hypothetical protein n=1 Tax=Abyssibius alkaniclasticus TaxID=2881234 RepID=UPI0040583FD8|tara:strand:- start:465 stop:1028 length:564 start_codon:yes stop_codon:yes gene_type:complete
MFRKLRLLAVAAVLAVMGTPSFAQSEWAGYDSWDTLYSRGNWRLDRNVHTDGFLSCESRTANNNDFSFSLFTWQDGRVSIRFQSGNWNFGDMIQDVEFVVKIDNRPIWNLTGSKANDMIQVTIITPDNDLTRFLREVRAGNTLYLGNANSSEITRFSLAGTTATLSQHARCEDTILSGGGNPSDPFL